MYRTLAHAPRVLDAAIAMGRAIRTDLDAKLRELVYIKVAQICACHV
jgi:alkylhydroperoxidase family enzyme